MMKKKLVTMLLAASMMVSSLVGCGSEPAQTSEAEKDTSAQATSTEATQEEAANFNAEGYPIVNEEITLDVMLKIRDIDSIIAPEEMPAVKRLDEQTGIKTVWTVVKESEWSTKLNLAFASGEYPDVILATDGVDYEEYGVEQGIVIPMDELIEQYMPLYTERIAMEDGDMTASLIASDGQKYTAGLSLGTTYTSDRHFFINQAWLDAVNMEMPKDIESLTEAFRAFKTQDPNGNGEADEIPFVATMTEIGHWAQLFGIPTYSKWLYIDDNKQVQLGPVQEKFRAYMEWIHMLYAEGLLDPEVITQDSNTATAKYTEGVAGFFGAYRLKNMGYDGSEATCTLYFPGEEAELAKNIEFVTPCAYITKTNEYPEATARWLNALLEVETMLSMWKGEENNEACGWRYTAEGMVETLGTEPETRDFIGSPMFKFLSPTFYNELLLPNANRQEKLDYCAAYEEAGVYQKYSDLYFLLVKFSADDNEKVLEIETNLNNVMQEYMAAFITDGVTDNKWNEFLKVLDGIGTEEYVQMYQAGIDASGIE